MIPVFQHARKAVGMAAGAPDDERKTHDEESDEHTDDDALAPAVLRNRGVDPSRDLPDDLCVGFLVTCGPPQRR